MLLVRATLRRDAQVAALAPLLLPEQDGARALAAHRLVWSLMPPDAEAKRDFLWREERPGHFLLLTQRAPEGSSLFDVQCKPFQPDLAPGDRLRFLLRANPTVAVPAAHGKRGGRADVVMHALHGVPGKPPETGRGGRADARPALITQAGGAWLERQGVRHGFELHHATLVADGYHQLRIERSGKPIRLGSLDFSGVLTVKDPAAFLAELCQGFGRGRAFGFGLMLIRRDRG